MKLLHVEVFLTFTLNPVVANFPLVDPGTLLASLLKMYPVYPMVVGELLEWRVAVSHT